MISARTLDPSEWHLVVEAGVEPFASQGLPTSPEHWRFVGVFDDGVLVGASTLWESVHNDGWWVAPTHRRRVQVLHALWDAIKAELAAHGVTLVHATVSEENPEMQRMVERFGFIAAPGKLYLLYIPDAVVDRRET